MTEPLQKPELNSGATAFFTDVKSSALTETGGRFFQYRGVILLAFFILTLWLNLTFLLPLVMGAILAVVLYPLMGKFDRWKRTRHLSPTLRASIITIAFTLLILIPIGLLIFAGVQEVVGKIQEINGDVLNPQNMTFTKVVDELGLGTTVNKLMDILPVTPAQFQTYATKGMAAAAAFGANTLQGLVTSLPGIAFSNIVLIFTMFFLLIDGPKAVGFIRKNSIFNQEQTNKLIKTTSLLCNSVIVATLASGAVQASIVGLLCVFTGTGNIILYTFVTFISSFLPLIGTGPVIIFLAIKAFIAGRTTIGIVWLVSIAVVGTSDNIVRPYVLKGGAELHPLIGFVAAFGALDAIGFYGLFIGPIVAGLFFTLLPMVTRTYPRVPRTVR